MSLSSLSHESLPISSSNPTLPSLASSASDCGAWLNTGTLTQTLTPLLLANTLYCYCDQHALAAINLTARHPTASEYILVFVITFLKDRADRAGNPCDLKYS